MSTRSITWLGSIAVIVGIALIIAAMQLGGSSTGEDPDATPATALSMASPTPTTSDAMPSGDPSGEPQSGGLAPLMINVVDKGPRGFQLQFDPEQMPTVLATAETKQAVVHAVLRFGAEGESGLTKIGVDAVVVRPDLKETRGYPLYESSNIRTIGTMPFDILDDRRLLFVRESDTDGLVTFDLATLDIESGEMTTVAKAFWVLDTKDPTSGDDFLIGSHYTPGEGDGMLLLASHQGHVWTFDLSSGTFHKAPTSYPAYGDPGSTPPRELVYPSPDLTRFVHQLKDTATYRVIDTAADTLLGTIVLGEAAVMNPGITWSPDGSIFYLEFDIAGYEGAKGISFDNGNYLFAKSVSFYDRDGFALRTVSVPAGSNLRMNVFGWADDGQVWLEYYRLLPQEGRDSIKSDVIYKLLDVKTGKQAEYKTTDYMTELGKHTIVRRNLGNVPINPIQFLLADEERKIVWQPEPVVSAIFDHEALYMHRRGEERTEVFGWDAERLEWRSIDVDDGEERHGDTIYSVPSVHAGQWLIYTRHYDKRIDYVPIAEEADSKVATLPVIPASFKVQMGTGEWWTYDSDYMKIGNDRALRARGITRFGTIELRAEPGEASMRDGGATNFHGDYRLTFEAKKGTREELPRLVELSLKLELENSVASMRSYVMDGFDLVLFQPIDYRFSQGYDGGIRETLAYAVTEQGEAFPLTFVYAMVGAGRVESKVIPIDINVPVAQDGEHLVVRTMAGGSLELRLSTNLKERTLSVVGVTDRSVEYNELLDITTRYTSLIEQELGLTEGVDAAAVVDAEQLRELFSQQALRNPGLKRMKADFAKAKADGYPSRAFAWAPINSQYVSPDTIRFTFTLNLFYSLGMAAHLEVVLKREGDEWKIHDLGTLETEKMDDIAGYNGLVIKDNIEL